MIWHPLLLAVVLLDSLSFLLISAAALNALRIAVSWSAESACVEQILLEVKAETASMQARSAAVVFLLATLVLVVGISNVLPAVIPGAMCGTGVLQACKGFGNRALTFRLLTIGILYVWNAIDRLNRTQPNSPLTMVTSKVILVAIPIFSMAYFDSLHAILALDAQQPVNCCAIVYDQVRTLSKADHSLAIREPALIFAFVFGGTSLAAMGIKIWAAGLLPKKITGYAITLLCFSWVPLAYFVLLRVLAAYHYQVLYHHCPWCLFLPEHLMVGYPLLGSLLMTCLEGATLLTSMKIAAGFHQIAVPAVRRLQLAGLRIAVNATLFMTLAGLPAVIWRLRYGVWM